MINCDQNKCVSLVKTGKTFSIYLKANVQANPTKCAQHFICKTIFYGKRFISASSPKNIEFDYFLISGLDMWEGTIFKIQDR